MTPGSCECGCGLQVRGRFARGHGTRTRNVPACGYAAADRGYETPCWVWGLSCNTSGYAHGRVDGKLRLIHVTMWIAENGPVPVGLELDHLCEVRRCVNPAHLQPVTRTENVRRSGVTRLTSADIDHIRSSPDTGVRLAEELGVSAQAISHVRTRRTWTT